MHDERFDVLVVGSGPAGSVAAMVLARAGARVALADKAPFPREKACGDLVGPRGVALLGDLGIEVPSAERIGGMVVVGPSGRRVRLPCFAGETYPGYALAAPRRQFDAVLRDGALAAGAEAVDGRAGAAIAGDGGALDGFELSSGRRIVAGAVIGADGAASHVASTAGLVDHRRVLWGFAVRAYAEDPVTEPHIVFWDETRRRGFPGYGWVFPGVCGRANVGLGLGVLSRRAGGARAVQALDGFLDAARRSGVLKGPVEPATRLGGWLKMGVVGTVPAAGRVLLAGDAAGLVNPLQGEGISQAMASGRAAAEAILADPGGPAPGYLGFLRDAFAPYLSVTVPIHATLLPRPRAVSAAGRLLTLPGLGQGIAGGWSLFWNDLVAGAAPGAARRVASAALLGGRVAMYPAWSRRWLDDVLSGAAAPRPATGRPGGRASR